MIKFNINISYPKNIITTKKWRLFYSQSLLTKNCYRCILWIGDQFPIDMSDFKCQKWPDKSFTKSVQLLEKNQKHIFQRQRLHPNYQNQTLGTRGF